jgi:transcriptional antiterminator
MGRVCIYTKDIQQITGKSERQSRQILKQIRLLKNKEKHQLVTIEELCDYLGIQVATVQHLIR